LILQLKEQQKKDEEIAARLTMMCPEINRNELFAKLQHEKFGNAAAIPIQDQLRRDYKEVEGPDFIKAGISANFENELEQYCTTKGLAILIIMSAYTPPGSEFRRDLALFSPKDSALLAHLSTSLEASELQLKALSKKDRFCSYFQLNATASRKVVAPLVDKLLKPIAKI